jgi:sugar phosphate isomerase/epimerase
MIKSCITLSLVPSLKGGPWVLWDDLETSLIEASKLGFDGVELFTEGPAVESKHSLASLLNKFNLSLGAVGTGAGKVLHGLTLTHEDTEVRKKAISFVKEMIAFGAEHGAPAILGSMQGNSTSRVSRETALKYLSECLEDFGETANSLGTFFIYEPLNRYETNLFNHFGSASDFLNGLSTNGVKLLADLFHMNIEEENIAESIKANANKLGHVHFADSNRRPIGYGHTEIEPISRCIKEIGYSGYVSAEAFAWPDPVAAAQKTIDSFRKFFQ